MTLGAAIMVTLVVKFPSRDTKLDITLAKNQLKFSKEIIVFCEFGQKSMIADIRQPCHHKVQLLLAAVS